MTERIKKYRRFFKSMRFHLLAWVMAIVVFLVSVLIFSTLYAIGVVRRQVSESKLDTLRLYMSTLESNLGSIETYLASLNTSNLSDIILLEDKTNLSERYAAQHRLFSEIMSALPAYVPAQAFFIYSSAYDNLFDYLEDDAVGYSEHAMIKKSIGEDIRAGIYSDKKGWFLREINGKSYLFRVVRTRGVYLGAWVSLDRVLETLGKISFDRDDILLFVDNAGRRLSKTRQIPMLKDQILLTDKSIILDGSRYLVIRQASSKGEFALIALLIDNSILEGLDTVLAISLFVAIFSASLVLIVGLIMNRLLLSPLKQVTTAMDQISQGDLDAQLSTGKREDEFRSIYKAFNKMAGQIKQLKIDIYEEQLSQQRTQLQYMHERIKPHFYLNCLNLIYGLAEMREYGRLMELTECLMKHFRYVLRAGDKTITLREEIEHVYLYMKIQSLRYPGRIIYSIHCPHEADDIPIPPLLIHTFVENAVKYAFDAEGKVTFHIVISIENAILKVMLWDEGKGFEPEVLERLKKGEPIFDRNGEHYGIHNAQQRMRLMYGNEARITFQNQDTAGACITLIIPMKEAGYFENINR